MKKTMKILIAAAVCASVLAACAPKHPVAGENEQTAQESAVQTEAAQESAAPTQTAPETEEAETEETEAADGVTVRVAGLKGPTTMGLVRLIDDAKNGESENRYEFTMATAADEVTAMVAAGKTDIALLPANVASVLYNKTEGGVAVIDINTLGVLYLVSADTSVASIGDLSGRTVCLPGKGTTPEYVFRYLIAEAGLGEDEVTFRFCSEAAEVASILAEDTEAIGLLPQPFVTAALAQNDKLSIVADLTEEWDRAQSGESAGRLVTGVTIVNSEFLAEHGDLVDTFLKEHRESIAFTEEDPDAAAELIAKQGIVAKAPLAKKALPYCNIRYIDGEEMKEALNGYLGVLFGQDPQSVGGALPDDAFYYIP